jgi:hypothetical protein
MGYRKGLRDVSRVNRCISAYHCSMLKNLLNGVDKKLKLEYTLRFQLYVGPFQMQKLITLFLNANGGFYSLMYSSH